VARFFFQNRVFSSCTVFSPLRFYGAQIKLHLPSTGRQKKITKKKIMGVSKSVLNIARKINLTDYAGFIF